MPPPPPSRQCDILSPFWRTRTLAHIHTHSQPLTDGTRSLPPHTCIHTVTHTVLGRRGKEKRRPVGGKHKKNCMSDGLLSMRLTSAGCWRWTEPANPTLQHTHNSPLQPRILGLVRPGVESGSRRADQHGEPGGETGGNRIRSASVVWLCPLASLVPLGLCRSLSVHVKDKGMHLLNTKEIMRSSFFMSCQSTFLTQQALTNKYRLDERWQASGALEL